MLVKNATDTAKDKCNCANWLEHWKKFSHQTVTMCSEVTCTSNELVGAHIKKVGVGDTNEYIVPLCQKHNMATEQFSIVDYVKLVSTSRVLTCGY